MVCLGLNILLNACNPHKGRPHGITSTYRTSHPAQQPNQCLLPWRSSLRVQPFKRSRCSQSIVIQSVGVHTRCNANLLSRHTVTQKFSCDSGHPMKARGSMTRNECRSTTFAEAASCNRCVVSCGEFQMNRLWIIPAIMISAIVAGTNSASAAYCGAISYEGCCGCGVTAGGDEESATPVAGGTYTCMRTVRETVYDKIEETRYRTRNEVYYEDRQVQCSRLLPETTTRNINYTVMVPTYETRTRTTNYTVCKPVYEKHQKTINYTVRRPVYETCKKTVKYTVCKPVYETHQRTINYTVKKPVYETCTKTVNYTVCKPVYETKSRTIKYTVCKPVYETKTRQENYTVYNTVREQKMRTEQYSVCVPEQYTRTVTVKGGHWETKTETIPGPVMRKTVRQPGTWTYDPCTCKCVYTPGKCHTECVQCPPKTICKKCWVPTCEQKEICCTRYRRECRTRQVPYTVCRVVPECRTKTCTYRVCKMVPECRTKTCNYTVCRMVPECKTKEVAYKVCRMVCENRTKVCNYTTCKMVPECRTKEVCYKTCRMVCENRSKVCHYTTCKMVPESKTKTCTYRVCKMVPECRTRTVCETKCRRECYTKNIKVRKCRQVCEPYTVTRCVPRVVCKQVPVEVCCPAPCRPAPCRSSHEGPVKSLLNHIFHGHHETGCTDGCEQASCGCATENCDCQ